ncbi:8-amino-7-oxononanoate synthase [Halomonas halocynthiae]|uniref:8-amino-7-oxononanoate synthase n=1 Tax=Halomonas halocynthiae TaxID=176290 RepID=UPI0004868E01|nr:8-amino-7-oxononanoate synthase [Halomonas halocynthiae]
MPVFESAGCSWGKRLSAARAEYERSQRWRVRQVNQGNSLDFASNDYLGLALDPRVCEAQAKGARRFGAGAGASHLVNGHLSVHEALEVALAEWLGRERALLFSTGYMANLGVLQALADPHTAIFQDRLNHASLIDGATLSGAPSRRFHHCDMADLQRLLARNEREHRLVVSDGVFSMDGDVADIAGLSAISRKHRAWLMIDDAHGVGVLGERAAGCTEGFTSAEVPILIGTLGKALGTAGAFVAGDTALVEHVLQFSRSYTYTTAQPPGVASATLTSLEILQAEPERRHRLRENIGQFRCGAQSLGLPLAQSETPIQPLLLGDEARTLRWADELKCQNIAVGAIRPPSVPRGQSRLRVTLRACHRRKDIDRLLETLGQCLRKEAL